MSEIKFFNKFVRDIRIEDFDEEREGDFYQVLCPGLTERLGKDAAEKAIQAIIDCSNRMKIYVPSATSSAYDLGKLRYLKRRLKEDPDLDAWTVRDEIKMGFDKVEKLIKESKGD